MNWFIYIVKCRDNSLYTGITTDLNRRVAQHNNGEGAKSLRGKRPVKLVYYERFKSQKDAAKREKAIKNWKRENKLKLINKWNRINPCTIRVYPLNLI